jgi:phasin
LNGLKVKAEPAPATKASEQAKPAAEIKFAGAEVPQIVRVMAEKSASQAKETYDAIRMAAENASGAIEDCVSNASKGATALNRQIIGAIKENATAQLDLASDLAGARSPAEALELQNRFVRARMEAVSDRTQAIVRLFGEITLETAKPIRENASRAFDVFSPAR